MTSVVGINYNTTSSDSEQARPKVKPDVVLEIPVQIKLKYLDYEAERKYFRRNLKLTLVPFLICLMPTYLFFARGRPRDPGCSSKPQAYSILGWLRFVFSASIRSPVLALFNIIFLLFAVYANGSFILALYRIVSELFIHGEFHAGIIISILTAFRAMLLLVGVDGVWFYGHRFRFILTTLGRIQPPDPIREKLMPCVRIRLGGIYAVLIFIHAYHAYMFATERIKGQEFESWHAWSWLSYLHEALLASLCFPMYCGIAWTLVRHCTLLRAYLRSTTTPAEQVIPAFKLVFRDLSTCYQLITYYFSIYLSWAIIVHLFSISEEFADFTQLLNNHGGVVSFLNANAAVIRGFVTLLLLLALKFGLVFVVLGAANQANTEAHYLRMALNDFMGREAQSEMSTDTYQAYRVLKYYVESRLLGAKPSVLQIPFVTSLGKLSRANFNTILIVFVQIALLMAFLVSSNESRSGFWGGSALFGKTGNISTGA